MGHRRNNQSSIVLKPDKTTVKEVVNTRGQEQPVLSVQSLLVRGISPGLTMARDQMNRVLNPGYPTSRFKLAYAVLEKALPLACPNDGRPIRFWDGCVVGHLTLQVAFPEIKVISNDWLGGFGGKRERFNLLPD
jgi:hypothetical protein